MTIQYSPEFIEKLKKADVRIRKHFKERIVMFSKHPQEPILNNHPLGREYRGFRSINITADWRAIFEEVIEDDETIYYFVTIGTHKDLYEKNKTK